MPNTTINRKKEKRKKDTKNQPVEEWDVIESLRTRLHDPKTQRSIALYILLLCIFAYLEFGTVFFIGSLFYFIYINTSTETPRKDGERVSAYSVFNKNMKPLDGQITAEQFEKEIYRR